MLKGVSDYIGFSVTCNRIFLLFPKEKILILLIPGTGNGERESGNECTAVTCLRIQNGGLKKRKGSKRNSLSKREFLPAVPTDDQYVFLREETDWHWNKQSM